MKTLGDLLKSAGYTPKDGVAAGQIEKIEIHRENRLVRLKTKFEAFVPYSDLREVNGMLHERILRSGVAGKLRYLRFGARARA